jgi:C-terminal processing protease CtpA/Prc
MMKLPKYLCLFFLTALTLSSCADDNDDRLASDATIKNFVYRGMNAFYLYKPEIDVLADDRFETVDQLEDFHSQFDSPEAFFQSLVFQPERVDRFSVIFDDYVALEQALSGQSQTTGMEFGLVAYRNDPTNIFGYVRYVLPNSSAAENGVQRGQIFNGIDGIQLTRTNFRALLAQDSYTINLADLDDGVATANGNSIALTKSQIQEDPIQTTAVIQQDARTVGYLSYTSFLRQFDEDLNDVFGDFKAQGVTDLVLDLRYNGGGSVNTAIILGSLIAGNPTSDVFSTEEWNPDIQQFLQENNPDQLVNFFKNSTNDGSTLNSLNLSEVYIITSSSSASASELVINALEPYINVIQVGDDTVGKFQASITLYDSEDFDRENANPAHRYAMQPQVLKSLNSVGRTDYIDGLAPDIRLREDFENLGTLGNPDEPLLQACLQDISPGTVSTSIAKGNLLQLEQVSGSTELQKLGDEMWKEDISIPMNR